MKQTWMPKVLTNEGVYVIIDKPDLAALNGKKITTARGRAVIWDGRLKILAREIMKAPKGLHVDHIDGNALNNRRSNLRICSASENCKNQKKRSCPTSSVFKGVSKRIKRGKVSWSAHIKLNYKYLHLGVWRTERQAAIAYNLAASDKFGEFAKLNKIPGIKKSEIDSVRNGLSNPKKRTGSSKFRGVCFYPDRNRYMAYINKNGKRFPLGRFKEESDAALAVNKFILENKMNHPLNIL